MADIKQVFNQYMELSKKIGMDEQSTTAYEIAPKIMTYINSNVDYTDNLELYVNKHLEQDLTNALRISNLDAHNALKNPEDPDFPDFMLDPESDESKMFDLINDLTPEELGEFKNEFAKQRMDILLKTEPLKSLDNVEKNKIMENFNKNVEIHDVNIDFVIHGINVQKDEFNKAKNSLNPTLAQPTQNVNKQHFFKNYDLEKTSKALNKQNISLDNLDNSIQQKINKIDGIHSNRESHVDALKNTKTEIEKEHKTLNAVNEGNKKIITQAESKIVSAENSLEKMGFFKKLLSQEAKNLRNQIKDSKAEIKEFKPLLKESTKKLNASDEKLQNITNKYQKVNNELEANKKVEESYKKILKNTKQIRLNNDEMQVLLPEIDKNTSKLEILMDKIKSEQKAIRKEPDGPEKTAKLNEIAKMFEEQETLENELNEQKDEYKKLHSEVESCSNSIEEANKNVDNLYKTNQNVTKGLKSSNVLLAKMQNMDNQLTICIVRAINSLVKIVNPTLANTIKTNLDYHSNSSKNWVQNAIENKEEKAEINKAQKNLSKSIDLTHRH